MNPTEPLKEAEPSPHEAERPLGAPRPMLYLRKIAGAAYFGLLLLGFAPTLIALTLHVAASQLHSYVLLIPFISAYLIYIQWNKLPKSYASSPIPGVVAAGVGLAVAISSWAGHWQSYLSENDYLGVMTFSFLCLLVAGGFFFLGRKWMAAVAFPVAFLFFLIPMPDAMVDALENASKVGSTHTANWFFALSGVPYIRQGAVFLLPDITIQVAQECSGIRSSWILLITSLVASYLFLRTPWRRTALVAFVIPLGLLRNGFRILVIGLMCVKWGPGMINSPVHTRGGPIFFVLSLFPLLLFLWWLRRSERRKKPAE